MRAERPALSDGPKAAQSLGQRIRGVDIDLVPGAGNQQEFGLGKLCVQLLSSGFVGAVIFSAQDQHRAGNISQAGGEVEVHQ